MKVNKQLLCLLLAACMALGLALPGLALDRGSIVFGEAKYQNIVLTDDAGGGYTYYKLRDLGRLLDFDVRWNAAEQQIEVETGKPYVG